jgi:hypothetical protein
VPWEWGQHPGIVNDGVIYRARRYEDLLTAWQMQADKEQAEDEAVTNSQSQVAGCRLQVTSNETPTPATSDEQSVSYASAKPVKGAAFRSGIRTMWPG